MSDPVDQDLAKKRARVIIASWFGVTIIVAYCLVVMTLVGLNALQGWQTRSTIVDCIEPAGECAQRGSERTAEVVQELIDANQLDEVATRRIVIIAAACSKLPGVNTVDEVQKCVDRQLSLDEEQH
jgi:hypothetical protein